MSIVFTCLACAIYYPISGGGIGFSQGTPITVFTVALYHTLFEISPIQATIGKVMFGIRVTNLYGKKLGFFKSLFRLIFKTVLIACFGIGILHLLVSLLNTKKKQGIHDSMMGTVVVLKEE